MRHFFAKFLISLGRFGDENGNYTFVLGISWIMKWKRTLQQQVQQQKPNMNILSIPCYLMYVSLKPLRLPASVQIYFAVSCSVSRCVMLRLSLCQPPSLAVSASVSRCVRLHLLLCQGPSLVMSGPVLVRLGPSCSVHFNRANRINQSDQMRR